MAFRGAFHLPVAHQPVMAVPDGANGGARCSTCTFVRRHDDGTWHCASKHYQTYMRTSQLIAWDKKRKIWRPHEPDEMCSDWYERK